MCMCTTVTVLFPVSCYTAVVLDGVVVVEVLRRIWARHIMQDMMVSLADNLRATIVAASAYDSTLLACHAQGESTSLVQPRG